MNRRPPHIRVEKPWGNYEQYTHEAVHARLALHGELGKEVIDPSAGEKLFIPCKTVHRLSAVGDRAMRILEISFGEFDEEDIVRLEDAYGRVVH